MALCANTVQANPQSYYFALSGGGGGTGSTLQSPASVIPDGTGTATLGVQANQAGGSAAVAVLGGATSTGAVTVGGFGQTYRMGVLTGGQLLPSLPPLTIGLNSAAAPAITYDPGVGSLTLGDGNATGVVQANSAFFVSDSLGGANKLGMSPSSATESVISQTVASGGRLNIGSSAAYNATLEVVDNGTQAYAVVGGNGGNGVYLNGTATNLSIVGTTAALNTNGQLVLAASTGATNTVNLTDSTMTVDQVLTLQQPPVTTYGAAVVLPPPTTIYGGGINGTFNVSTYADGLWLFVTEATGAGISEQTTLNAMVSGTMYIKGGKVIGGGFIGVVNQSVQTQVLVGQQTVNIINSSTNNIYYQAFMYQLSGAISGL